MRALRKRKTQATQALALATMIVCFDWAFLLAGACVRCVKNLTQWPLASVAWLALAYFCFFACVIFSRLLRLLCTFYFACVLFLTQGLACVACVWMETGLKTITYRAGLKNKSLRNHVPKYYVFSGHGFVGTLPTMYWPVTCTAVCIC